MLFPSLRSLTLMLSVIAASIPCAAGGIDIIDERVFLRGDSDGDGCVTEADAEDILDKLSQGGSFDCEAASDANGDGSVAIDDAIFILNFLGGDGPEPPPPFPGCGRAPIMLPCDRVVCPERDDCDAVETVFQRGDANGDQILDLSDAVFTLNYLFLGGSEIRCQRAADVNDSNDVDLTDAIYGLSHIFLGGPRPPAPYPDCGTDPSPDSGSALECDASPCA